MCEGECLQGAAGLLLFLRREGAEGEEEDGQTGLTGNRAEDEEHTPTLQVHEPGNLLKAHHTGSI